jgi:CheY-like chemotaxis protein
MQQGTQPTQTVRPAGRVLIVDDSRLFRAALATVLDRKGYDVALADNAGDALAALPGADVIVFDLELPGLDGTRLLAALSRANRLRRRAVIALAGSTDAAVIARLRALGVQQVLVKPLVGVNEVCRAVMAAMPPLPRPLAA